VVGSGTGSSRELKRVVEMASDRNWTNSN